MLQVPRPMWPLTSPPAFLGCSTFHTCGLQGPGLPLYFPAPHSPLSSVEVRPVKQSADSPLREASLAQFR